MSFSRKVRRSSAQSARRGAFKLAYLYEQAKADPDGKADHGGFTLSITENMVTLGGGGNEGLQVYSRQDWEAALEEWTR